MAKRRSKPITSNKIKRGPKRSYIPEAPIVRIVEAHKLSIGESSAALDILNTSRKAAGLPPAVDTETDLRLPIEASAADDRASKQSDMTRAYSRWRTDMRDTAALRVADAVLFSEQALSTVDEKNKWPRGTALGHLMTALRHFAFLRGNAPRGSARDWKFNKPTTEEKVT